MSGYSRAGPLVGILFLAVFAAGIAVGGDPPDSTSESAEEVAKFYVDNEDEQLAGAFLLGLSGVLFVFWAGWLRSVLRAADPDGMLPAVAFGGALMFAFAIEVSASLNLALAGSADDIDPVATQAINAISWDWFLPFGAGLALLLISAGLVAIRSGALPKWLGWAGLLVGLVAFSPAGFYAFHAAGLWILAASFLALLASRRARKKQA